MDNLSEIVTVSLISGVGLGVVWFFQNFISHMFLKSKIVIFLVDALFVLFACVVSFLIAIAVSAGFPRLIQFACELIGFFSVLYLSDGLKTKYKKSIKFKNNT